MRRLTLAAAVVAVLMSTPLLAGDSEAYERNWPQWRGPHATGVAPHGDPPVEWSETKNIRWKTAIPGRGHSSPVIWEDLVFVTTAIPTDKAVDPEALAKAEADLPEWRRGNGVSPSHAIQFAVLAVDRTTGAIRWRRDVREAVPHEGTHTDGTWASPSAVTDGKILIAHFGSNGTYALDLDGKLLWERDLGDMQVRAGFGEGSSPVILGDRILINWDHEGESFIVALDRKNGKTLWKAERDEPTSWATPLVVELNGKPQVIVPATGKTRAYDPANGEVIWEAGGMTMNAIPSPVSAKGRVYLTSGFRGNALQAIDLAKALGDITESKAILWQHGEDTPYVPSPLLYNDRLYFLKKNNGILSCFDTTTGKPHYGPERLEAIDGVYASPVGAAGRVYIAGRNGTTVVFKDGPKLEMLAENALDDAFDASPAVVGDAFYLRGTKNLYCIAPGKGQKKSEGRAGS
jgi:outer membrane protein assembly factor BamB